MSENARIMETVSERNTFKQELVKTTKPADNTVYNKCLNVILYYNFMDTYTAKGKNISSYKKWSIKPNYISYQYKISISTTWKYEMPLQGHQCWTLLLHLNSTSYLKNNHTIKQINVYNSEKLPLISNNISRFQAAQQLVIKCALKFCGCSSTWHLWAWTAHNGADCIYATFLQKRWPHLNWGQLYMSWSFHSNIAVQNLELTVAWGDSSTPIFQGLHPQVPKCISLRNNIVLQPHHMAVSPGFYWS